MGNNTQNTGYKTEGGSYTGQFLLTGVNAHSYLTLSAVRRVNCVCVPAWTGGNGGSALRGAYARPSCRVDLPASNEKAEEIWTEMNRDRSATFQQPASLIRGKGRRTPPLGPRNRRKWEGMGRKRVREHSEHYLMSERGHSLNSFSDLVLHNRYKESPQQSSSTIGGVGDGVGAQKAPSPHA